IRLAWTVCPRAHQRRLPAASGSRDDRHLPRRRAIEGSEKIAPVDQPGCCWSHLRGLPWCLRLRPAVGGALLAPPLSVPGQRTHCQRRPSMPRSRESPGSGDDLSPAWRQAWVRCEGSHGHQGTCPRCKGDTVTSPAIGASGADALPDYAPVPRSALGPVLNDQGYYVGRVERNLYWVTDGTYQAAFLTTPDGVVLLDAPPTIGHNLQRAVDEMAAANGVSNKVNYIVYSHHHADHVGASSLFDKSVTRIG